MTVIYQSKSFFQTNWFTDDSVPPTIDGEIDGASFDRINWSVRNSFKDANGSTYNNEVVR